MHVGVSTIYYLMSFTKGQTSETGGNCYGSPVVLCLITLCSCFWFHASLLVLLPGWQNNGWSTYGEDCCVSWDNWDQARLLCSVQILPPCRQEQQQTLQGLCTPLKLSLSSFMSLLCLSPSCFLSFSVFLWPGIFLPFTLPFFLCRDFSLSKSDLIEAAE